MAESEGREEGAAGDVVLYVCVECGREYQYEGGEAPPADLECEKCGNRVFRRFDDSTSPSEAAQEFREETERDLATSDPEGDAESGDLRDLNNP